jgi:hypothetical protein
VLLLDMSTLQYRVLFCTMTGQEAWARPVLATGACVQVWT